ncbi:hypothetical protein EJB05_45630 [Eragrostis curvula]|uniref:RRM domain-containing protein n=1 Tax=Eragrostis curvula TaxID=38414 RepID=A0A5J9TL43_9POAL|nr:hypothetical protein EJB05_45630 [Eragrostis curvula]
MDPPPDLPREHLLPCPQPSVAPSSPMNHALISTSQIPRPNNFHPPTMAVSGFIPHQILMPDFCAPASLHMGSSFVSIPSPGYTLFPHPQQPLKIFLLLQPGRITSHFSRFDALCILWIACPTYVVQIKDAILSSENESLISSSGLMICTAGLFLQSIDSKMYVGPRKLYVGALHPNINEKQLRQAFEPFGQVELVQLPLEPLSGLCKGFWFCTGKCKSNSELQWPNMNRKEGGHGNGMELPLNALSFFCNGVEIIFVDKIFN